MFKMADQLLQRSKSLLILTISAAVFICTVLITIRAIQVEPSDARCDQHTYPWSPALEAVSYHWETFENHQFSIKTPYFGFEPTEEHEELWNELLPSTSCQLQMSALAARREALQALGPSD